MTQDTQTSAPAKKDIILFAQVNRFSYTNDALERTLPAHLEHMELRRLRVFPMLKRNPLLLLTCLYGVVKDYGFKALFDRKGLPEKIIKSTTFFHQASRIFVKTAQKLNAKAVIQTQGLFNAKVPGVPLIIYTDNTVRNSLYADQKKLTPDPRFCSLEDKLYEDADTITVAATHVATSLKKDYGIDAEKIETVFIGANAPQSQPSADRFKSGRILFVGIDWERKGGPELVRAYLNIVERFPHSKLILVGCQPDVNHPNIEVKGLCSPETVADLMGESAIFCTPSYIEPAGVAVIEASRAGLPILATTTGGFLDTVLDKKSGFLVTPGDVKALSQALETLLSQPELCEKMGKEAAQWISQSFEWDIVSQKIAGLIKQKIA